MRKVKRFAALFLTGAMSLSVLAGCGNDDGGASNSSPEQSSEESAGGEESPEESSEAEGGEDGSAGESDYEDTVSFSITSYNTITGTNYTGDEFYQYMADRFNIDVEVMANEASGASEKIRTWIMGGTMPDAPIWEDFSFSEYNEYINQGLLQPLPDGWETRWPNLAKLVQLSGYGDAFKVDGKVYAIPHSVFGNYMEMDPVMNHASLFYRKDWAKEVGMEDLGKDYKISLSELKEYLEKVKEAGLTNDAFLSDNTSNVTMMFCNAFGIPYRTFMEYDDGFTWCAEADKDKWVAMIKTMREWFQAGLIDPDYAVINDIYDARTALEAGTLAAMYDSGDCVNMSVYRARYQEEFPDRDAYEDIGVAHIGTDDGSAYIHQVGNYWTVQIFAPETDSKTLERILDLMDWIASPEGQCAVQIGIPGVDWEYDADNNINVIHANTYPSQEAFYLLGYCNDDFAFSGAREDVDQRDIDDTKAVFAAKEAGNIIPLCTNYDIYDSDTKKNYSVNITSKVTELVCGTADIEAEWDKLIEDNRAMWEPLQEELNAAYGY